MLKKIKKRHPKFSKPLFFILKLFCKKLYRESILDDSFVPNINSRVSGNNMIRVKSCDNFRSSSINCRPVGYSIVRTNSLDNIRKKKMNGLTVKQQNFELV